MGVQEYLKTAAAHLRRAAFALKSESDQARHDMDNMERDLQRAISDLESSHHNKQTIMAQTHDTVQRALHAKDVQQLNKTITDRQRDLAQLRQQRQDIIRSKTSDMQSIINEASALERRAG